MNKEQYLEYRQPEKPHLEWTDAELFDEVIWCGMHILEVQPQGERRQQLSKRLANATLEQMARYAETHE